MGTLTERLGPDRMEAFVTRLGRERPEALDAYYLGKAAELGRYAGLKYENVALLEQADRDEAEARAAEQRLQKHERGELA